MEALAALLATTVGAIALVRFYSSKDYMFLFIGVAFLGSAFLDAFDSMIGSGVLDTFLFSEPAASMHWGWLTSRLFLSVFLFLGSVVWQIQNRFGAPLHHSDRKPYLFAGILALTAFAVLAFVVVPRAFYPELAVLRAGESIAALFFLAALANHWRKGAWRHDIFERWLMLSLVSAFAGDAFLLSFSRDPFDSGFVTAHLLELTSNSCVLTGFVASIYALFRQREADLKALRKAQGSVKLALEKLIVFDNHLMIAATDIFGTFVYVNDKFCDISGYSEAELIGVNHRILNSGHHPKSFFAEIYRSTARGEVWHGEIKSRAKDGSHFWLATTVVPMKDDDGKITEYFTIQTDVSDRKAVETDLQENTDILCTTFDNFPGGISVISKDLVLQAANPAFYRLLELPEEMFPIGSTYEAIIRYNAERGEYGEGDIDELVRERVELANKFEKHSFKRIRPGGTSLEIRGWPLPEGGFITIYMDITDAESMMAALKQKSAEAIAGAEDLRRAKEAHDQAHQHLWMSVNSMRNGFVIWGADDRLLLANDAYRNLLDPIRDMVVEGALLADLLSAGLDCGIWDTGGLNNNEWIRQRIAKRRQAKESELEQRLADGRQIIISEQVLDNGEVLGTIIDVTAHRRREEELLNTKQRLERIAYFDGLTGLANRAHCQKDLAARFTMADPSRRFAVIQIDLDNFKRVNDTLSHAAGDHLLRTLGERLTLFTGEFCNFKPYRWGGDEFVAVVEHDDNTDLASVCEELTDLIAIPLKYQNTTLRPTVSLGVARYPEDATDLEALMIFADLALYKTKELGRDGYQFFTSKMKEDIDAESRIEQELRVAIDEGQLELYYQPQLNVHDETITGFEALLRWNHPDRGMITPGDFLSVVESSGLAPAVGRKVFDDAMAAVRRWVDDDLEFGRMAVNLSPQHLRQGTVLDDYFGAMDRHGVDPRYLGVEFLESFLLDDPNANVADILKQLLARGIHVELDDFGTGYASLSHLSTMPINGLKIDRSFVQEMIADPKQQVIVSSLISLSKLMNLRVVCEGIESWQQVQIIARIGKCSIQGYFVARPMAFEAATDWIRNGRNMGIFSALPDVEVVNG